MFSAKKKTEMAEKRTGDELDGTATKRQRTGVGSSVATLVRSEADDLVLLLTKIRVEQLRPKSSRIVGMQRL